MGRKKIKNNKKVPSKPKLESVTKTNPKPKAGLSSFARISLTLILIILSVFVLIGVIGVFIPQTYKYVTGILGSVRSNLAAVFFKTGKSPSDLIEKYKRAEQRGSKVKVLVVAGHEPNFGGTEHNGIYERVVVADIAKYLKEFMSKDTNFEVVVSRTSLDWNPDLKKYFEEEWEKIKEWRIAQKEEMAEHIKSGKLTKYQSPPHNDAPEPVAIRLYGINKWANDNNFDVIVHLHLNDYYRSNVSIPGSYSGFSIYVPEKQYSNSNSSRLIAKSIFDRLSKRASVSDLETESEGIVEDQDLVAIGAANTLDGASVLIEYGYMYEPQFQSKEVREVVAKELAYQTYAGIDDFFGYQKCFINDFDTTLLPYEWKKDINKGDRNEDILRLQYAMAWMNKYPPTGKSVKDCPFAGYLGECTTESLIIFQKDFLDSADFEKEKGIFGPKTREKFNELYFQQK